MTLSRTRLPAALHHRPALSTRSLARAGAVAGVLVLLSATRPAIALDLDAAARQKLDAGEPVTVFTPDKTESAAGIVEAVIDIPAAPSAVWAVLTDCPNAPNVFNGLKSCKIVSQEPGGSSDVREHVISWSRLLPTLRSVFRSTYDQPNGFTFAKVEGDLKSLEGGWRLEPVAQGKTRLHYRATIAVGIPVPNMLVRAALESDMPKTLKAIRAAATTR